MITACLRTESHGDPDRRFEKVWLAPDVFDLSDRYEALSSAGDALERLAGAVDFEVFRGPLIAALRRSIRGKGGRSPFDPVLMFKILVLQALYSLDTSKNRMILPCLARCDDVSGQGMF